MRTQTYQQALFTSPTQIQKKSKNTREKIGRLDSDPELREKVLPLCRLETGEIWEDNIFGHKVGVLDATNLADVQKIMGSEKTQLIVNDPPYNIVVGNNNTNNLSKTILNDYMVFSKKWVENAISILDDDSHFYIWLGADYKDSFQPLPDFMIMMRDYQTISPRNFITMRNQRGFGTQKNWMWVRQELLHYIRGNPDYSVTYTDIPKILRGYYKKVNGKMTENFERSKSDNIRPGNVWVDIQQVFYRMEENVPGCYAQKPIKSIDRIVKTSSKENDLVVDFFSHSGTTLIVGETMKRKVYTFDIDPIFAELSIRRLENYRKTGKLGWQWEMPFLEIA